MNTLTSTVGNSLNRVWQGLAEGWKQLRERASHAMTHFTPLARKDDIETWNDRIMRLGSRWGVLASDVEENNDSIIVHLEAPGMEAEDFDISVVDNYLLVRGVKQSKREHKEGSYHVLECAYGRFERAIPLPVEVEESKARARYKRGVLTVTLPKSARGRRRYIEIKSD
ncbi:MAG TPA: Hsp20/alpha crystallin family protein [Gammaproteobacteria bacterium]|nr:Hsp20/alpha crystallin family protein [Gammaproteobacteria bacterium]